MDGQGGLACCGSWGRKESDTSEQLNWTDSSMKVKVAQSCLTLFDPMNYTVNGILQARILEGVAFPCSRGSSQPKVGWSFFLSIKGILFFQPYLLSYIWFTLILSSLVHQLSLYRSRVAFTLAIIYPYNWSLSFWLLYKMV